MGLANRGADDIVASEKGASLAKRDSPFGEVLRYGPADVNRVWVSKPLQSLLKICSIACLAKPAVSLERAESRMWPEQGDDARAIASALRVVDFARTGRLSCSQRFGGTRKRAEFLAFSIEQ